MVTYTKKSEKKLKCTETKATKLQNDNDKLITLAESKREALKIAQIEAKKAAEEKNRRIALELREANEKSKSKCMDIESMWKQKLTKSSEDLQKQARAQREMHSREMEISQERINQVESCLLDKDNVINKITKSLADSALDNDKLNSKINSTKQQIQDLAFELESKEALRNSCEEKCCALEQTKMCLQASIEEKEKKTIQLENDKLKLLEDNKAAKQDVAGIKLSYEDKIKTDASEFEAKFSIQLAQIKHESRQDIERIQHELGCAMTKMTGKHNQDMLSIKEQLQVEKQRCNDIIHIKEKLRTQLDHLERDTKDLAASLNREVTSLKKQLEQKHQKYDITLSECKRLEAEIANLKNTAEESTVYREKAESIIKSFQQASASEIHKMKKKHDEAISEIYNQTKQKVEAVKKEASDSFEAALKEAAESERNRTVEREWKHKESLEIIRQDNKANAEQMIEMEQKLALIDDQVRTTRNALESSKQDLFSSNTKNANARKEIDKLKIKVSSLCICLFYIFQIVNTTKAHYTSLSHLFTDKKDAANKFD